MMTAASLSQRHQYKYVGTELVLVCILQKYTGYKFVLVDSLHVYKYRMHMY